MPLRRFISRLSLTHRLLALTLVASLPGLLAVGYSAIDLRNTRYNEVRSDALRNARIVVSEVDQIFDGLRSALRAVAEADEVINANSTACTDYIARLRPFIEPITALIVVGTDGNIRCFSDKALASPNLADRSYVRESIAQQKFVIGPFVRSQVTKRNVLPLVMPIVRNGNVMGVLVAGLNLEWLGRQLQERGVSRGGVITIADRNGIVVSREPDAAQYVGRHIGDDLNRINGPSPGTIETVSMDGVPRIFGYVPTSQTSFGLYVSSGTSHDEAFGQIDRATRNSIALFLLGAAVAFALAWLVGEGFIRRPLMRMVATAEAWRRGHDAARTGIVGRNDEIGILGQTFDRLMDENAMREEQRAAAEERRDILVHELAHRVKNTLATVQSIASLSFRNSQGPEALRQFHDRLQALVRSHDLLTRKNWRHADLAEVAEAATAPLKHDREHRFSISGEAVNLPPTMAVPMAMILHELCTNAMKYGALSNDTGRITIRWTAKPDPKGTGVSLIWSEDGGPPVVPPTEEGFGTRLISNLCRQLGGDCNFRYPPSGLVCHLSLVISKSEMRD